MLTLSPGSFSVSCSASDQVNKEAGGECGQGRCPEAARRIFCAREGHVQSMNWGERAGRHQSLLGDGMDIGQWVGSNCAVHHLCFLGFITFSLSLILLVLLLCFTFSQVFYKYIYIVMTIFYSISVNKLFLSQS